MDRSKRIILVDDDEDILWINQMILQEEGHVVDIADNSEVALKMVNTQPYDVAILDYMLPKMRGDELANKIISSNDNTAVIFITGYSDAVSNLKTVRGCCMVLTKPISPVDLIQSIEKTNDLTQPIGIVVASLNSQ